MSSNKPLHIIVGSQMGAAEAVADELAAELNQLEHANIIHEHPDHQTIPQEEVDWLICTSTYGAGDPPDNLLPFLQVLQQNRPNLSKIHYGIICLGDSSYDTFCKAGADIDQLLNELGAIRKGEVCNIDVLEGELPEDSALEWLPGWLEAL